MTRTCHKHVTIKKNTMLTIGKQLVFKNCDMYVLRQNVDMNTYAYLFCSKSSVGFFGFFVILTGGCLTGMRMRREEGERRRYLPYNSRHAPLSPSEKNQDGFCGEKKEKKKRNLKLGDSNQRKKQNGMGDDDDDDDDGDASRMLRCHGRHKEISQRFWKSISKKKKKKKKNGADRTK